MAILAKKLDKVRKHAEALQSYKSYIDTMAFDFDVAGFNRLSVPQKAVLEAYLRRFASLQDYLGAKVFASLLEHAGIGANKMSEVLTLIEKEGIISLDRWITFRTVRNHLEHDYPDELEEALEDLRFCVESFDEMMHIVDNVFAFAERCRAFSRNA